MICIAGGGTGGHLAIARALANELRKREIECIFIGSSNGQDKMWFEKSLLFSHKYFLPSSGVVNKKGIKKLFSLLNILKLAFLCLKIFKEHKIKAVISVGGYSSAPASFAAILARKYFFIHEQNAVIGRLNSLLLRFATGFFSSYHKGFLAKSWDYPVKDDFFAAARKREKLENILFLGGSQGAKAINELALELAPKLKEKNIKITHQCGKNDFESVKAKYDELGIPADVFDFSDKMPEIMNKADLAISRAGASTLWELCANALPAIFVPYPHAASNHQYFNADFLAKQDLAKIIIQSEISSQKVLDMIENMDISSISQSLKDKIKSGASKEIIDEILKICSK